MHFALLSRNDHCGKLFVDDFAGIDNLIQHIMRRVPTPGRAEVRAGHATFVAEAMTGETGRCRKNLPAVVKVAMLQV